MALQTFRKPRFTASVRPDEKADGAEPVDPEWFVVPGLRKRKGNCLLNHDLIAHCKGWSRRSIPDRDHARFREFGDRGVLEAEGAQHGPRIRSGLRWVFADGAGGAVDLDGQARHLHHLAVGHPALAEP